MLLRHLIALVIDVRSFVTGSRGSSAKV